MFDTLDLHEPPMELFIRSILSLDDEKFENNCYINRAINYTLDYVFPYLELIIER